jgi:Tfp pilus assembly protein PilO
MNHRTRPGSWIVTVSLVAAAVAYMLLIFLPGRRAIGELREQLGRKQSFLAQNASLAQALTAARHELEKAETYCAAWKQRAPAEGELSALYGKINELTKAAGTITTRFDPKPVAVHERTREIPVTMGCTGTFAEVFALLRSLESLPPTIWLDTVQFKKNGETGASVAAEINLVVFANNSEDSDYVKRSD